MIKIGEKQTLNIIRMAAPGAYLVESAVEEDAKKMVLLPGAQVPKTAREGDLIDVFVYRDSKDRPIATVNEPLITLGKVARLKVLTVGNIGAFLDWGLEKDLLLPFKEQAYKVKEGDDVLCALYLDKSKRLCATMKLYKYLEPAPAGRFHNGGWEKATVYEISETHGIFCAVRDEYPGLIPKQELTKNVKCGDRIEVRVARIRPDGRLDLSLRDKAYMSIDEDVKRLLAYKEEHGGEFPFNDKSDPEDIRKAFGMSKAQFKRAYGHVKYGNEQKKDNQ